MKYAFAIFIFLLPKVIFSQSKIDSFRLYKDVLITIDQPPDLKRANETILIFYALPNGNTTAQTMGKKMKEGDDWHFDIQHIKAQTQFLRKQLPGKNIIVAYLENDFKSWPSWKQKHADFKIEIPQIVDSVFNRIEVDNKIIYFNGHSGGGSFIFGYLDGIANIPFYIKRISFIDSNYGYDSLHYPKLKAWLQKKNHYLTVFAYNDSVALYNGKPVVSAKGGTWYKSHLMLRHLQNDFKINKVQEDSLIIYKNKRIGFFFKTNPERKIFHTHQVELNGFIHSVLFGTKKQQNGYRYFGERAYSHFIRE